MNDIKIIISATFRDFNGTDNDKIQKLFLQSIENQTYANYNLVVTLFGEKMVECEVNKFNFKSYFYNSENKAYRYSLTDVILNSIDFANKDNLNNYIILWTTCDIILDKNFLHNIILNYKLNIIGTSHPHICHVSVDDYNHQSCYKKTAPLFSGFDLIYFDKNFINNKKVLDSLKTYKFKNWGLFEHFLISLKDLSKGANAINLYDITKIKKIENDRKLVNEKNDFLIESHAKNAIVFNNFLKNNKLSNKFFDLTYCHNKFKVSLPFKHCIYFKKDLTKYIIRSVGKNLLNMVPQRIKKTRKITNIMNILRDELTT